MTRLEELVRQVAQFKAARGGAAKLVDDRGDLLVAWPRGCPDAPTTRDAAIEQALVAMREAGFKL